MASEFNQLRIILFPNCRHSKTNCCLWCEVYNHHYFFEYFGPHQIRDWAPQVVILDHQTIGGFMTHCGWNSMLEAISAGVPMITWPMFTGQFYNEKLVTRLLKIGVRVGAEQCTEVGSSEKEASVKKKKVEEAVSQLMMSDREEVKEMRRTAKEFKEMAEKTVEEDGSSYKDLNALIKKLRIHRQTSTPKENQVKLDLSV